MRFAAVAVLVAALALAVDGTLQARKAQAKPVLSVKDEVNNAQNLVPRPIVKKPIKVLEPIVAVSTGDGLIVEAPESGSKGAITGQAEADAAITGQSDAITGQPADAITGLSAITGQTAITGEDGAITGQPDDLAITGANPSVTTGAPSAPSATTTTGAAATTSAAAPVVPVVPVVPVEPATSAASEVKPPHHKPEHSGVLPIVGPTVDGSDVNEDGHEDVDAAGPSSHTSAFFSGIAFCSVAFLIAAVAFTVYTRRRAAPSGYAAVSSGPASSEDRAPLLAAAV